MRAGPALLALLAAAGLAACEGSSGRVPDSPFPPAGAPRAADSVDGLIVGHRLMAAGEYELALKAYYRAAAKDGLTADTLSAIGSANLRLGRLGLAERVLRQAIAADETFVPAWNNLGVTLMEQGEVAEARNVFQTAYALDSGNSDEIRENLRLAIAKLEQPAYSSPQDNNGFRLVRRGEGQNLLLSRPL